MQKDDHREACTSDCEPLVADRNRFFTGKYMTARDFTAEQDYFLSRHRLHNRLFHGWGVACGFGVTKDTRPECPGQVIVGPGIAIDCCGRELILRKEIVFLIDVPEAVDAAGYDGNTGPDDRPRYVLCAYYCEEAIEHVPVIYDDCDCDPRRKEANRVREAVRLELHRADDLDPSCWGTPGGGDTACRHDCDDDLPAPAGGCLDADCECGGCVPIAVVIVREDGRFIVETRGRRQFPPPPQYLTHVVATSWEHGGMVLFEDLAAAGRLEIRFDREILPAEGLATGINRETLLVQHAGEGEELEFLAYDVQHPPQLVDGYRAVFTIDRDALSRRRRGSLVGSTVYVTLLADFVLDCHGLPVDGDHLRGLLPSGNGIPGGVFRSWFTFGDGYHEEEEAAP